MPDSFPDAAHKAQTVPTPAKEHQQMQNLNMPKHTQKIHPLVAPIYQCGVSRDWRKP